MSQPSTGNLGFGFKGQTLQFAFDASSTVFSGSKNGTNSMAIFIDGINSLSTTANSGTLSTREIVFGARGTATADLFFNGTMDIFGIKLGMSDLEEADLSAAIHDLRHALGRE